MGRLSKHSLADITSGLPEDSKDADERVLAKREAERKGRVAAAMMSLEAHEEARELVFYDQTKLTQFCARFSVTPQEICPHQEDTSARVAAPGSPRDGLPDLSSKVDQVLPQEPVKTVRVWSGERALSVCTWCHGWHGWKPRGEVEDLEEVLAAPYDRLSEVRAREAAELPYDPEWDGAGWGVRGGFARA